MSKKRCPFCKKCFIALYHHIKYCKSNPNRRSGSNQYTLAKALGYKYILTDEARRNLVKARLGKKLSEKHRKAISKGMQKAVILHKDSYKGSFHRRAITFENSVYNSSWEISFKKFLDACKIEVKRDFDDRFTYTWKRKTHVYVPDFYLPEYNTFVEVKGHITLRDLYKWKYFPIDKCNLLIVSGRLMSAIQTQLSINFEIKSFLKEKRGLFFNFRRMKITHINESSLSKLRKINKEWI